MDKQATTTRLNGNTYQYCFGNYRTYEWDNLGGTSGALAKAFRTV